VKVQTKWRAGATSARLESHNGDPGTVSLGQGDNGGVSYGTYQLSSKQGTLQEYLKQSRYRDHFKGLEQATAVFNEKWKQVARDEPDFGSDQHDFIRKTHVDPISEGLFKRGLDLTTRGPAVQDMVWSTAVQYRRNAPRIIDRGLRESYGEGYVLEELSDVEIVEAVQNSKLLHVNVDFKSSDPATRQGVETRTLIEKAALIHLAETGDLATSADFSRYWMAAAPVGHGSPPYRVVELQEKLAKAGMLNERGERIVADGDFGPSTQQALRAYQRSIGIPELRKAGALTMHMLDQGNDVRRSVSEVVDEPRLQVCRLDDQAHSDHAFFSQVRDRVTEVDRRLGREPDHHTDSIASALTVQARADGLHRIDDVGLSSDGRELWGVQMAPGRSDSLFSLRTSVPTAEAMAPMEEIASRWPEAMRQFQIHDHARAESQRDRGMGADESEHDKNHSVGQRDVGYLRAEAHSDPMSAYGALAPEATRSFPAPPMVGAQRLDPELPPSALETSQGPDERGIRDLQQNLNSLGVRDMAGEPLETHGIYDIATQTAVARFQSGWDLPITGVADDTTRTLIEGQAFIAELKQPTHAIASRHDYSSAPSLAATLDRDEFVELGKFRSPTDDGPSLQSLNDPRHPNSRDHGLYKELERRLPESSEARLLQCTAVCHTHRIDERNLAGVHINYDNLTVMFDTHGLMATPAVADLSVPPPEPEQAIQQIQQFDQQMAQIAQQSQERSAQMSQQGPVM
jgi:peptidoglycan hydrolase-like protein with peptidoglycan-binding domain